MPIPALGATAALAKLCAMLVAASALAKLCARIAAAALGLLAASTSCGRLPLCVPHVTVARASDVRGSSHQRNYTQVKRRILPPDNWDPSFDLL